MKYKLFSMIERPQGHQPRSQGFSLFVIGKAGKGPGTGRSSMYSDWSMTRHYYANNAILN